VSQAPPVTTGGMEVLGGLLVACRQAWKLGRTEVGTEHLLAALADVLPALRTEVGSRIRELSSRVADSRRWQSQDNGAGDGQERFGDEIDATLREAAQLARLERRASREEPVPEWTDGVRSALREALSDAGSRRVGLAHAAHLVVGVCADSGNRAAELLGEIGLSAHQVLACLSPRLLRREGTPPSSAVYAFRMNGMLTTYGPILRVLSGVVRADAGGWRPGGFKPIVMALDLEASRQAVRRGAQQTSQAHYLLAIRLLPDQLAARNVRLADRWAAYNDAGCLLSQLGVTVPALSTSMDGLRFDEPPATGTTRRWRHRNPASLPYGAGLVAADERAHGYASDLGHRYAGTDHLLLALLADPAGRTRELLTGLGVDVAVLTRELAGRLGWAGRRTG